MLAIFFKRRNEQKKNISKSICIRQRDQIKHWTNFCVYMFPNSVWSGFCFTLWIFRFDSLSLVRCVYEWLCFVIFSTTFLFVIPYFLYFFYHNHIIIAIDTDFYIYFFSSLFSFLSVFLIFFENEFIKDLKKIEVERNIHHLIEDDGKNI